MKTQQHFIKALCAGLAAVALASPGAAAGLTIEMTNTISVTTTSAVLRARVGTNEEATAQGWLYWGPTNNGNNATWPNTNALGAVITGSVYTVTLSGLTAGQMYWATAYATNGPTNTWATWQTNVTTLSVYSPTSVVVTAYPDGRLRGPTNFFAANGIPDYSIVTNIVTGVIITNTLNGTNIAAGTVSSNAMDAATDAVYRSDTGIDGGTVTNIVHNVTDAGFLALTNYTDSATNALDIALRALISAATQASTNYTDSATNALDVALRAVIAVATQNGTNYTDISTNALRIWAESRAVASTQTIAGASVAGAVGSATVANQATYLYKDEGSFEGDVYACMFTNTGWFLLKNSDGPMPIMTRSERDESVAVRFWGALTVSNLTDLSGNVMTRGMAVTNLDLAGVNTNSASDLSSGTVPLGRLSNIGTGQLTVAISTKLVAAVTNGQASVNFTGTTTLTNLTVNGEQTNLGSSGLYLKWDPTGNTGLEYHGNQYGGLSMWGGASIWSVNADLALGSQAGKEVLLRNQNGKVALRAEGESFRVEVTNLIVSGVQTNYGTLTVLGGGNVVTNGQPSVSLSGTTTLTNLVVTGAQTNTGPLTVLGGGNLNVMCNVQYGGTNAALWYITTTNAYLDIGTNRIYLTP